MEALNIHQKLAQVQFKLKAPKGQYNSFGKYHYRSCEDILEGLKPLLQEIDATLTITDSIEHIGERYYVKATVVFSDILSGLEVTAYAREEESRKGMDGSQVTGSASSYARKYALNGMFCIDDTKDADATNDHAGGNAPKKAAPKVDAPPAPPAPVGATEAPPTNGEKVRKRLFAALGDITKSTGYDREAVEQTAKELVYKKFGVTTLSALTAEQWKLVESGIPSIVETVTKKLTPQEDVANG